MAHVTHIRTWPELRARLGRLIAWPGWRIALGLAVAAAAATVVWELVVVGPGGLLAELRLGLAYAGLSALFVFGLAVTFAPALVRAWQLVRAAHIGRAGRGSPCVLALGAANLLLGAALHADGAAWWQDALGSGALALGVWLVAVVLWPGLDAMVAKTIYLLVAGTRHPTPAESAHLEPVLREQVERLGLGWMPWLLVGQGFTAEAGQAFGSVVVVGAEHAANRSREQLAGLLAHELAHVALDHGRALPSVLVAAWCTFSSVAPVSDRVVAHVAVGLGPLAVAGLPSLASLGWLWLQAVLLLLGMSRDNYPREVAADAFAIEHGAARELEACLQKFDQKDALRGVWAVLLRTHPSVQQRLARARAALATDPAPNGSHVPPGR